MSVSIDFNMSSVSGFTRNATTRDYDGTARAVDEPRRGRRKLVVGSVDVEQYTSNTAIESVLACGVALDGKHILVRLIRDTTEGFLDIFVGDDAALLASGAPSLTSDYGYKNLNGGHLAPGGSTWIRYRGPIVGENSGSVNHALNTAASIEEVYNFGSASSPLLATGSTPVFQDALVAQPRWGGIYRGLICLPFTAQRHISGSAPDAVFSTDGVLIYAMQIQGIDLDDPDSHMVPIRTESHFKELSDAHLTGRSIRHDYDPGRSRLAEWARMYPCTSGIRSNQAENFVTFAGDDYMNGGDDVDNSGGDGGDTVAEAGIRFGVIFKRQSGDPDLWDLSGHAFIDFGQDMSSDGVGSTYHTHGSLIIEVEDSGTKKLAMLSMSADSLGYTGIVARILDSAWDSDSPGDVFTDFENPAKWSTTDLSTISNDERLWLVGNHESSSVSAPGQRFMCITPGNEPSSFLILSDDNAPLIRKFTWSDVSEPPTIEILAGKDIGAKYYSFVLVQRYPSELNSPCSFNVQWPDGTPFDNVGTNRNRFLYVSNDGEIFGIAQRMYGDNEGPLDNSMGFSADGSVLIGTDEGLRKMPWPNTRPVSPVALARGAHNIMSDDMGVAANFGQGDVQILSRSGGVFTDPDDGSIILPRDPSEAPRCFKYERDPSDGNSSLTINLFGPDNNDSTDGGLVDTPSQLSVITSTLLVREGWTGLNAGNPMGAVFSQRIFCRAPGSGFDIDSAQFPANGSDNVAGMDLSTGLFAQSESEWNRLARTYPFGSDTFDLDEFAVGLRFDRSGLNALTRAYIIIEGVFQGYGWPGYPTPPNTDNSSNHESISVGWNLRDGDVIFGICFIGEPVTPPLFPQYIDTAEDEALARDVPAPGASGSLDPWPDLKYARSEFIILEIGDTSGDDYITVSITMDTVDNDSEFNAPNIRVRGKVGGVAITPSDTEWRNSDSTYPSLVSGTQITVSIEQDAINGPTITLEAEGVRKAVTVATLSGQPDITLEQIGADVANPEYVLDLEWASIGLYKVEENPDVDDLFAGVGLSSSGGLSNFWKQNLTGDEL